MPPPLARGWENLILDLAVEPHTDETAQITWTQPAGGGWAEVQRVIPFGDSYSGRGRTTVRDGECEVGSGGTCEIADDGTLLYEPRGKAKDGVFRFRIRERTPYPEGWIRYTEDGRYWPWSDVVEVTLKGKVGVAKPPTGSGGGSGNGGGGGLKCGDKTCKASERCRIGIGPPKTYHCTPW